MLITSRMKESVFLSSRKQAMEMIPVAMTSAKYPGNRSAAARERRRDWMSLLIDFCEAAWPQSVFTTDDQIKATDKIRGFDPFYLWLLLLFITTLTVEFETDP